MSTKPYISSSNYILKMSNYKKGDWCDTLDGLYWKFTEKNRKFYESNPRLSMLVRNLDKMDKKRKENIFSKAEEFINTNTLWGMKRFVKLVKSLFPGEKNGKETGKMFYIVVKDAERIS